MAFLLATESAGADTAFKFRPKNGKIYHRGWIDLNKTGSRTFMKIRLRTLTREWKICFRR